MWKQGAWDGLSALIGRVNALEIKKVKATFFATISGGTTSGTVSKPAGGGSDVDFVMDEWGTATDALLSTLAGGKPTFRSLEDSSGSIITTTFNTAGEFAFSGTPDPADDVALVYVYTCLLGNFDVAESLLETELLDWIKPHADSHVDGTDDIRDATSSVKGLATAAQITRLEKAVVNEDFDAQTILAATLDDTPLPLTVAEDRIVGRISGGNIDDLTPAQVRTIAELDGPLSPMILSGGAISVGTDAGTFKVGALTALLRVADEEIGVLAYVTKAEEDNIAITAADTTYIVVLNYNGGSPTISISESLPNLTQNIPIGKVMKNGSNDVHYIAGGYMLYNGLARLHMRAKSLRALELVSGSTVAYSGTNNFTMTIGVVYGGINKFTLAVYNSASVQFTPVYGDGGSGFTEGADRNTIDFAHYDAGSGALGNIGVGRYGCHWVYRHAYDGHVYVVYGTESYKLAEAEAALTPSVPDHLTDFGLLIGKIIAPQAGGSFAVVHMVTERIFTGVSVATHNELGGLNDGDYKHLTATEKTLFDTIESGAKDDQTGGEIKTLYEAEEDTNALTDAEKAALHAQGTDTALGALGTKATPVDADKVVHRNSADSDALVTSTWTQVKAFLKTYFDGLYQTVSTAILKTTFTTKGDILVTTGVSTPTRLGIGSNTHVLTADSTETSGIKWATGGAGDVSAAANLGDHKVVRGDGGVKGVQESTIVVSDDGEMTNPSQPCFSIQGAAAQENITINTIVTILFDTEIFDVGNNFASNTFTAPIGGRYQLNVSLVLFAIDTAATYIDIKIVTSNRKYRFRLDPNFSGDLSYTFALTVLADMDVNDTAHITIYQVVGTAQMDTYGGESFFSGALIC